MEMTVYNPLKGRHATIDVDDFTDKNTTWFDGCTNPRDIYTITDTGGGLLISELGYYYPIWIEGDSRATIGYNKKRARKLIRMYL